MGKASKFMPAVGTFGHKWYPEDLAGIIGQPVVGNVFYVDATNGSNSSSGKTWANAFATLSAAHSAVTTHNYDVIIIAPNGTAGTAETATLDFSKSYVTVIGAGAPTNISQRARVLFTTADTSPQMTVSGNGNRFVNFQLATFVDSNILLTVTGDRNYFGNVHFAGIGDSTAGDDTAARCVYLNDGDENYFDGCMFGLDTIMRSAANYTVEMAGGVQRTTFNNCMFQMASDATTPRHVLVTGTSGVDRWNRFDDCVWYNFTTNDSAQIAAAFDVSAQTATGHFLLTGSQQLIGIDNWESTASGRLWISQATATANAVGQAINPTVD